LAEHFKEGESALFILHGQVFDYIRVNGDYLPFRHFLGHWLAQARQVVFYNLGLGLEFWDAAGPAYGAPGPEPVLLPALCARPRLGLGRRGRGTRRLDLFPPGPVRLGRCY
jgi:hypothetical protein